MPAKLTKAAIFHHPRSEGAAGFAQEVATELRRRDIVVEVANAWDADAASLATGANVAVVVGGDGTVLRASRVLASVPVPILGVNMGRLGFLTDLSPRDFYNRIDDVVATAWRREDRLMVQANVAGDGLFIGLNDIVVSRRHPGRPVYIDVTIDGAHVALYRCDGIIVATPTGSTGYSLAAGGPILAPTEHHLVMSPVSPHLALGRSIVLQPDSVIELRVTSEDGGILSVDGQEDRQLPSDCRVEIRPSEHMTTFARFQGESYFYAELADRLEQQLSSTMNYGN
jgi:NAD+ kinase